MSPEPLTPDEVERWHAEAMGERTGLSTGAYSAVERVIRLCDSHNRLAAERAEAVQRAEQAEKERDDYKTLTNVGRWHAECRPNRNQAAQIIRNQQETIDKMADAVSAANREREKVEAALREMLAGYDFAHEPEDDFQRFRQRAREMMRMKDLAFCALASPAERNQLDALTETYKDALASPAPEGVKS